MNSLILSALTFFVGASTAFGQLNCNSHCPSGNAKDAFKAAEGQMMAKEQTDEATLASLLKEVAVVQFAKLEASVLTRFAHDNKISLNSIVWDQGVQHEGSRDTEYLRSSYSTKGYYLNSAQQPCQVVVSRYNSTRERGHLTSLRLVEAKGYCIVDTKKREDLVVNVKSDAERYVEWDLGNKNIEALSKFVDDYKKIKSISKIE